MVLASELEEVRLENRNLKEELQELRVQIAAGFTESKAMDQLKSEISSLKKEKVFKFLNLQYYRMNGEKNVRKQTPRLENDF